MSNSSYRPIKIQLNPGHNRIRVIGSMYQSHLAFQRGDLCLWTTQVVPVTPPAPTAETDPSTEYDIYVAMTGQTLPPSAGGWQYLGTAISQDTSFVLHAYLATK